MAKLAVLISSPKTGTTHCPFAASSVPFPAEGPVHGRWLFWRVPRSRASCSSVSGRKEPATDTHQYKWKLWYLGQAASRTYAADSKHFRRNSIEIPTQDLPAAGRCSVLAGIPRGALLRAFGCRCKGGRYRRQHGEGVEDNVPRRDHRENPGTGIHTDVGGRAELRLMSRSARSTLFWEHLYFGQNRTFSTLSTCTC